jgi:phage regulator Rha-like protein
MEIQIINQDKELYVDSRIVASGFEIEHESLCRSLKRSFSDLKSEEGKSSAGRGIKYYLLTERQVMIIPAICKTTKKTVQFQTALVDAFFAMREQLTTIDPFAQLKTPEGIAKLLEIAQEKIELEAKIWLSY